MRQRGPTATALSPGLCLDGHSARVLNKAIPCTDNTENPGNLPGDVFANDGTIPSKFASISPVLSRIQSPVSVPHELAMAELKPDQEMQSRSGSVSLQSKLHRRHHKSRRIGLHQINGELGRNLHSLKVTIRRTSQSHKIDAPGTGSLPMENGNSDSPSRLGDSSMLAHGVPHSNTSCDTLPRTVGHPNSTTPRKTLRSNSSPHTSGTSTPVNACGRSSFLRTQVDASTSTLDRSTFTEPDVLGPCEPGSKIVVQGVVWLETAGMLVLNVQWRGRSYVGTLLDASRQSFAPTCMDKGITSALSLLDGRRAWSYSPSGRFRSRGVHHHFHHHRSLHHRQNNTPGSGGTMRAMTTRSAAAAAAAASASSNQNTDRESPDLSADASNGTGFSLQEFTTTHPRAQRGGKRRRRRGATFGARPYRRLPVRNSPNQRISNDQPDAQNLAQRHDIEEMDTKCESERQPSALGSSGETQPAIIACPYVDCKKVFDDLVSMRYHFSLGHTSKQKPSIQCDSDAAQLESAVDNHPSVSQVNGSTDSELICVDDPGPTSSPPPLGQAHEQVNTGPEDGTEAMATEDGFDNLEPPRLHRIMSITDSTNSLSHGIPNSSPKQGEISDEPPAPSPAYSDISDDGTVPADQSGSFLGHYNPQLIAKLPPNVGPALLSPPNTVFSTLSPRLNVDSSLGIAAAASPSTPLSIASPARPNPSGNTGFYFPLNLLSPSRPALDSSLLNSSSASTVFSSGTLIPNHNVSNTPLSTIGTTNTNHVSSARSNISLTLEAEKPRDRRTPQPPISHSTCTVSSQTRLQPNHFQTVNVMRIPGVNSFGTLSHDLSSNLGNDTLKSACHNPAIVKEGSLQPNTVLQGREPSIRWCPLGSPPTSNHSLPMSSVSNPSISLSVPPSQDHSHSTPSNTIQTTFSLHRGPVRPSFSDGTTINNHPASVSTRFPFVYRSK